MRMNTYCVYLKKKGLRHEAGAVLKLHVAYSKLYIIRERERKIAVTFELNHVTPPA